MSKSKIYYTGKYSRIQPQIFCCCDKFTSHCVTRTSYNTQLVSWFKGWSNCLQKDRCTICCVSGWHW